MGRSGGQMDGDLVFCKVSHSDRLLRSNRRIPPISEDCSNINAAAVVIVFVVTVVVIVVAVVVVDDVVVVVVVVAN